MCRPRFTQGGSRALESRCGPATCPRSSWGPIYFCVLAWPNFLPALAAFLSFHTGLNLHPSNRAVVQKVTAEVCSSFFADFTGIIIPFDDVLLKHIWFMSMGPLAPNHHMSRTPPLRAGSGYPER